MPYNALNEILQGTELSMPGASYDMFVSGIYNPQMNSTQDALTYNEAGDHGDNLYIIRNIFCRRKIKEIKGKRESRIRSVSRNDSSQLYRFKKFSFSKLLEQK